MSYFKPQKGKNSQAAGRGFRWVKICFVYKKEASESSRQAGCSNATWMNERVCISSLGELAVRLFKRRQGSETKLLAFVEKYLPRYKASDARPSECLGMYQAGIREIGKGVRMCVLFASGCEGWTVRYLKCEAWVVPGA